MSKARILALLSVISALGILPAASAMASESPSSNLKISITVTNLATGQPLASRETVAAGTPFQVTVSANGIDCVGQFVVSALGAPGSLPSVLVQFVPFIIDGSDAAGSTLVAGALPSGGNDFKVSASCNGADPKSFSHEDFEFFVGA